MHSDTQLIAKDASDATTQANVTSPRPESNGRRPVPGLGQPPEKRGLNFTLLTRAILDSIENHLTFPFCHP